VFSWGEKMTLSQAAAGKKLKVVALKKGNCNRCNLASLGIHVGDEVIIRRAAPFSGPLLVEVLSSGIQLAVGRGMASSMEVEMLDE